MNDVEEVMETLLGYYKNEKIPTVRRTSKSKDPFKTLISCLLSLRTQDKNTEKEYLNLMDNLSLGSLNKSLNIMSMMNNIKWQNQ